MTNASVSYNSTAKFLHWGIALLIAALFVVGWIMNGDSLPDGELKGSLFMLHKSLGISVLALTLVRIMWRLMNPIPPFPAAMRGWEKALAKTVHFALYLLMLALPLSGWALSSAAQRGISWFGLFNVPFLPGLSGLSEEKETIHSIAETHETLASIMLALLVLHVLAALKHHFVDRDDTLTKMLPCHSCCRSSGSGK